jgi:hypothetical protein
MLNRTVVGSLWQAQRRFIPLISIGIDSDAAAPVSK